MLVMTRKPGDAIRIGENVVLRVLEIQGGKVQIGIEAPKDVRIASLDPVDAAKPVKK